MYRSQRHKQRFSTKASSRCSTLPHQMLCQVALMWPQKSQVPFHALGRCTLTCACVLNTHTHICTPARCTLMHAHIQKQLSAKKSHPTATSPPLSQCGVPGPGPILPQVGDAVSTAVAGARPVYQVMETMQLSFCAKSGRRSAERQPYSSCHCCRCAPLRTAPAPAYCTLAYYTLHAHLFLF